MYSQFQPKYKSEYLKNNKRLIIITLLELNNYEQDFNYSCLKTQGPMSINLTGNVCVISKPEEILEATLVSCYRYKKSIDWALLLKICFVLDIKQCNRNENLFKQNIVMYNQSWCVVSYSMPFPMVFPTFILWYRYIWVVFVCFKK